MGVPEEIRAFAEAIGFAGTVITVLGNHIDPTGKIRLSRKAILPTADVVLESERP